MSALPLPSCWIIYQSHFCFPKIQNVKVWITWGVWFEQQGSLCVLVIGWLCVSMLWVSVYRRLPLPPSSASLSLCASSRTESISCFVFWQTALTSASACHRLLHSITSHCLLWFLARWQKNNSAQTHLKNKLLAADSGMQRAALWHCVKPAVKPTGIIKVYNIMRLNRSLGLSTTLARRSAAFFTANSARQSLLQRHNFPKSIKNLPWSSILSCLHRHWGIWGCACLMWGRAES